MKLFYRTLIAPLAFLIFHFLGLFNKKIRQGLKLRYSTPLSKINEKWRSSSPFWIHCSSGEFEYAKPIIRELKRQSPQTPLLVTYFSPTYKKKIEADTNVDISLPLPFDFPGPLRALIRFFKPRALLIARTDLWPECIFQCEETNTPTFLFATTVSDNKLKRGLGQLTYKYLAHKINHILLCESEDKKNLLQIIDHNSCHIAGDPRYDQAFYRLKEPFTPTTYFNEFCNSSPTLIAGSTWSEDERALISGLRYLISSKQLKLILAPHEPTKEHLAQLTQEINKAGLNYCYYSKIDLQAQVLVVDSVGILANLYPKSEFAFIGGSFKKSVHSVMEALAAGCVTFIGPFCQNNREASVFKNVLLERSQINTVTIVNSGQELEVSVKDALLKWSKATRDEILVQISTKKGASKKIAEYILSQTK